MQNKNSCKGGFALIELLVVVLIIGILAGIALPQYRKAVIQSKLTQLTAIFDAAKKAREMYVLSNGEAGVAISAPQYRGEFPVELLADECNDSGDCKTKIGVYRVDTQDIYFEGNGDTGFAFGFIIRKTGSKPWMAGKLDVGDELSAQVICSWIKDNGYPTYEEDVYKICQEKGGVTLKLTPTEGY